MALEAGATIIGVNSRNLRTLEVDVAVFDELAPLIPLGRHRGRRERAPHAGDDLARLRSGGYDAFLIGERFMTEADRRARRWHRFGSAPCRRSS